jgi:Zn-dependent protease
VAGHRPVFCYLAAGMMRLGSIGKTSIDVDFSFLILILFFVAMNYDQRQGIQYALVWIPVIFVSVLVHELAHAATIAIMGFGASRIILGGMGGVTINSRRAQPWQDMLISISGPLASGALMVLSGLAYYNLPIAQTDPMMIALLPRMFYANKFWALFNLIPVPPLDGGHATRDFFRIFLSERRAFVVSIWIAIVVGGAVAVYQLFGGQIFIGIFVAWFVYVAVQQWLHFRRHGTLGD